MSLLGFVVGYQWVDQTYMPEAWTQVSVEGGLTALLALGAVGMLYAARKWRSCGIASMISAGLTLVRLLYLHIGDTGAEGERFFFNALLLQFGIPFLAACVLAFESGQSVQEVLRRVYQVAAMAIGLPP